MFYRRSQRPGETRAGPSSRGPRLPSEGGQVWDASTPGGGGGAEEGRRGEREREREKQEEEGEFISKDFELEGFFL